MRPQDILILLKILSMENEQWLNIDVARGLKISQSEITESLERSKIAKLIDSEKRSVFRTALLEFLVYGLKYVFPVLPGPMVRGIPTSHSAPPLLDYISKGSETYVWPDPEGDRRGQSIIPLYKTVPQAVKEDSKLYELLVLTDAIRVGRAREVNFAVKELSKRLNAVIHIRE